MADKDDSPGCEAGVERMADDAGGGWGRPEASVPVDWLWRLAISRSIHCNCSGVNGGGASSGGWADVDGASIIE